MKFLSLRWKISGILVFSNLFLGIIIIFIINQTVASSFEKEVIERGRVIAREIARFSAELILEEDNVALGKLINSTLTFETAQYILVQDNQYQYLADTFNGKIPNELNRRSFDSEINQSEPQLIMLTDLDVECYDILHPIEEGSLGYVRIGLKRTYILEKVRQTVNYIIIGIFIITVVGIVIVYFLANKIVRPILELANRANEISIGKLDEKVSIKTNDEINYLAEALERLRESLNIALARLERNKTIRI
jgi:HAMP domain-containing protein